MVQLGLATEATDCCTVHFRRTIEGKSVLFNIAAVGKSTIDEIAAEALEIGSLPLEELDNHLVLSSGEGSEREEGTPDAGLLAGVRTVESTGSGVLVYDDEDEEISPEGVRSVYFHQLVTVSTVLLSFNPPVEEVNYQEPTFVSIDQDFTIQHLSDAGVLPGAEILYETYNPRTRTWGGDLDDRIRHAQVHGGSPIPSGHYSPEPEKRLTLQTSSQDVLTVKTVRGMTVRIPCGPLTTMATVLQSVWCVTGDLPEMSVLQSDTGRVLQEWDCLVDLALFPQATLHVTPRPRPWLGDSPVIPPPATRTRALDVPEPDAIAPNYR